MTSDETPAVKAAQKYFRSEEERSAKGTGLAIIAAQTDERQAKTARLRAARQDRDAAQAIVDAKALADAPAKKPVRKRKKPEV